MWSKVQKGLSAGRVQSVAVRLIVEREKEIDNHKAISSFKAVALFDLPGKKVLKAELSKTFAKENEAVDFLKKCVGATFSIKNLETKAVKNIQTVKGGETLGAIAKKYYGSAGKYTAIFNANTNILKNPDVIHPGQELVIPNL
mgnify:CR=1 FL=1